MIVRACAAIALACVAVALAGCRSAPVAPAVIADAQTVARVKTALVNDVELGTAAIEVRVVGGVAHLTGRVRSTEQAERAARLTRAVPGVTAVESNLQVGGDVPAVSEPEATGANVPFDAAEPDSRPGLLAVGATIGWSIPYADSLKTRASLGPLFRFGSPRGLSPVIGFDWFQADLASFADGETLVRVRIKPVMAGVGYTVASDRVSLTPSIVAGYAFNSLTITDTGVAHGLPVDVANSLVWRVGLSVWHDVGRRTAINASLGYLKTGLRLTVIEDARLVELDASGDTAILHVGLAYKLF